MVTILPRSAWTTTIDNRNTPLQVARVNAITVHYPVGRDTKGWSKTQVAKGLRNIRASHLNRGWRDIGYNYAGDQSGRVWNLTGDDVGAHANTVGNTTSIGFVFIVGTNEQPTPELINAFRAFRAMKLRKFPHATRVQGHQQVPGNATACPGGPIMALIRSGALTDKPSATPLQEDTMALTPEDKDWHRLLADTRGLKADVIPVPSNYGTEAGRKKNPTVTPITAMTRTWTVAEQILVELRASKIDPDELAAALVKRTGGKADFAAVKRALQEVLIEGVGK